MQPLPSSSRQHFPQQQQPKGALQEGDLATVPEGALEQAAAFARLLANPDFAIVLAWLEGTALEGLRNCGDAGRVLRAAKTRWKHAESIRSNMEDFVHGIEDTARKRAEQIKARSEGTAPKQDLD